jgi:hypothetical protein
MNQWDETGRTEALESVWLRPHRQVVGRSPGRGNDTHSAKCAAGVTARLFFDKRALAFWGDKVL